MSPFRRRKRKLLVGMLIGAMALVVIGQLLDTLRDQKVAETATEADKRSRANTDLLGDVINIFRDVKRGEVELSLEEREALVRLLAQTTGSQDRPPNNPPPSPPPDGGPFPSAGPTLPPRPGPSFPRPEDPVALKQRLCGAFSDDFLREAGIHCERNTTVLCDLGGLCEPAPAPLPTPAPVPTPSAMTSGPR